MPSIQVAGRHGSYATQFWKVSAWTSTASKFRDRAAMRTAYSRKALDRRLVLPLDTHNWIRALEVLNAGYARLGRTPEHFQAVLRDMVDQSCPYADGGPNNSFAAVQPRPPSCSPCGRGGGTEPNMLTGDPATGSGSGTGVRVGGKAVAEILPAVDALRERAYAGEIPSNRSLWVTLVWSYCTLDQPSSALDAFYLARRRFHFSSATTRHMATLLLPVLCRHAQLEEAVDLYERYLKVNGTQESPSSTPGSFDHRSCMADSEARRWIAEAAARRGDWKRTQDFAVNVKLPENGAPAPVDVHPAIPQGAPSPCTIDSLFDHTTALGTPPRRSGEAHVFAAREDTCRGGSQLTAPSSSAPSRSLSLLHTLSREAVRQLFRSRCRSGIVSSSDVQVRDALLCWEHLYGSAPGGEFVAAGDTKGDRSDDTSQRLRCSPPVEDVRELLNLFASLGRWQSVLSVFCPLFLNRPSTVYLSATPAGLHPLSPSGRNEGDLGTPSNMSEAPTAGAQPQLDPIVLNLLFASFPTAEAQLLLRRKNSMPASSTPAFKGGNASLRSPQQSTASGEEWVLQLPASAVPATVVSVFDDLLLLRDDMVMTDFVMAAIGPALLQLGQVERLFDLLARTPMMMAASQQKAPIYVSSEHQALKAKLVALGYAAFTLCSSSARRHDMVRQQPHLFPPEVVRSLAAQGEDGTLGAHAVLEGPHVSQTYLRVATELATSAAADDTVKSAFSLTCHSSVDRRDYRNETQSLKPCNTLDDANTAKLSLLDMKLYNLLAAPAGSAGRHGAVPRPRGQCNAAALTSLADDAMRRDYVRLSQHRRDAFRGSHADAERDPRPIPKGLHDHASGWDFFGRGGEMVFGNHKGTPHPFTMHPKVMRGLRNPYRGWNPRQNSSLAHKENVIKWNGKSAV